MSNSGKPVNKARPQGYSGLMPSSVKVFNRIIKKTSLSDQYVGDARRLICKVRA